MTKDMDLRLEADAEADETRSADTQRDRRTIGLRLRVALILGLAMLPIGTVGTWQAHDILRIEREKSEETLLNSAQDRVSAVRSVVSASFAALDGLAASDAFPGPRCAAIAERYVAASDHAIFVGFTDTQGQLRCRSDRGPVTDVSEQPGFLDIINNPRPTVALVNRGAATGQLVTVVATPVEREGRLTGFVSISIPGSVIEGLLPRVENGRDLRAALIRTQGSALLGDDDPSWLPEDVGALIRVLERTSDGNATLFRGRGRDGMDRVYALAPVVQDELVEVSAWAAPSRFDGLLPMLSALAFPPLMWLTAAAAAFAALERLVVRPVTAIRRDMRAFGQPVRRMPQEPEPGAAPELAGVHRTFGQLSEGIVAEEERMRQVLAQQHLLLKEVHHRVLNNLQIITTMIRMHASELEDDAARDAVMQLEDRIMAIAAIHGASYDTGKLDAIWPAPLFERVLESISGTDWATWLRLDVDEDLTFEIETALSVSMILAELVISLKPVGSMTDPATISIASDPEDPAKITFGFAHTITGNEVTVSAFGQRMIDAFTLQLDADRSEQVEGNRRTVSIRFRRDTVTNL